MNNTSLVYLNLHHTPSNAVLIITIVGMVTLGIAGMLFSAMVVVVISLSKALHSPCFTLIAGGGVGSFFLAAHYFARGLDKMGIQLGLYGYERTGLKCLLLTGTLGMWGLAFHAQMVCLIAIDRLISVTAPIKYRRLGQKYSMGLLIGCGLFCIIQEIIGFLTSPLHSEVICTEFMDAMHPTFILTYGKIQLFYSIISVLAYIGMMICFHYRHLFVAVDHPANQDSFMKQQLAVMPTIKLMVTLYLITGVLAELLVNIGLNMDPDQPAFILISIGTILKDVSCLVEGLALLVKNKRFRDCARVLIKWHNKVAMFRSSGNRNNENIDCPRV